MAGVSAEVPAWVAPYIGVPFVEHGRTPAGWDCWGCARWIFGHHFAIDLPDYDARYRDALDQRDVAAFVVTELPLTSWRKVEGSLAPGDGLLFRIDGFPTHVGVLVARDWFVHVDRGCATALDRLSSPRWTRRFLGAYRWAA